MDKMVGLYLLKRIREYCDYLEEHLTNVEWAWKELQDKCKHMRFIYDDYVWSCIDRAISEHDISKFSAEEFIQYSNNFFPITEEPDKVTFNIAWENHKENNPHHWEHWTAKKYNNPYEAEINCVCMVADWMAMGKTCGDTAKEYYDKNKERIGLPEWADKFVNEIFECVYKQQMEGKHD